MQRRSRSTATTSRSGVEQAPGQTAGSGTDLIDRFALEPPGNCRDPGEQLPVEDEILAERLAGAEPVPGDDGAARGSKAAGHAASKRNAAHLRSHADRRGHRPWVGEVLAGNVERRAVVGRGPDDRQAERDVDAILEMQGLHRDQRLVVVHAKRGIVVGPRRRMEQGVGGVGSGHPPALRSQRGDRRLDDLDFLAAERAAFTGVRIEPGDGEARVGDAEIALQPAKDGPAARFDEVLLSACHRSERNVGRDRHGRAASARQASSRRWPSHAAALGDELGLAGMREADRSRAAPWRRGR